MRDLLASAARLNSRCAGPEDATVQYRPSTPGAGGTLSTVGPILVRTFCRMVADIVQQGKPTEVIRNVIAIGIAAILSTEYAVLGNEMKDAAELAVEECNTAGGINGTPVSAYVVDDQANLEQGCIVAHELCGRAGVLGVIGHFGSEVSIAASDAYLECGLAMITPIASNPKLTERRLPNVFRFTNRDDRTAQAIAGYLLDELGKRQAVIVQSDYVYGKSMAEQFSLAFSRRGGEIVAREDLAVGQREFGEMLSRLPAQFDLVFYGGAFEGAYLLKAMRRYGFTQLFAAGDGCWDVTNFLQPAADAAAQGEGVLILSATPVSDRSAPFVVQFKQRYGPVRNYAVNSYDATRVLLEAIRTAARHRVPKRQDVIAALRGINFPGIAYEQPVSWDEKGDNSAAVTALYVVERGSFRQVAVR